jgi:PPOX class probable F420-dependent enzyme
VTPLLDAASEKGARAERRLREELVIWLTTVRGDGQPQSIPVWFWWDGESFLVYVKPGQKLANLRSNPRVALNLNTNPAGGDVVRFEGTAEALAGHPPAYQVPQYLEKYRARIERNSWTPESFSDEYSQALRILPSVLR